MTEHKENKSCNENDKTLKQEKQEKNINTNESKIFNNEYDENKLNNRKENNKSNKNEFNNLNKSSKENIKRIIMDEIFITNNKKKLPMTIKTNFSPDCLQFIKYQLNSSLFSAWIREREYVESLKSYRDVIEINEWENAFNTKLQMVMNSIQGVNEGINWINITAQSSSSPCYCLWVLLTDQPVPGHYWIQITDVFVDPKLGLQIRLKIIREVNSFDGETKEAREHRLKKCDWTPDEWKDWALQLSTLNGKCLWKSFTMIATPSNIVSGIRFVIILLAILVMGAIELNKMLFNFLLRFIRELGVFIHHVTPFLQSVVTFIEKLVGGFYLLIAMMFRDFRHKGPTGPIQNERMIQQQRRPMLCDRQTVNSRNMY